MILHSIKWRLQAWHGFLLVCLVSGLLSGFYVFERREKMQALDSELGDALTPLLPRFAPPNNRGPDGRPPLDAPTRATPCAAARPGIRRGSIAQVLANALRAAPRRRGR